MIKNRNWKSPKELTLRRSFGLGRISTQTNINPELTQNQRFRRRVNSESTIWESQIGAELGFYCKSSNFYAFWYVQDTQYQESNSFDNLQATTILSDNSRIPGEWNYSKIAWKYTSEFVHKMRRVSWGWVDSALQSSFVSFKISFELPFGSFKVSETLSLTKRSRI